MKTIRFSDVFGGYTNVTLGKNGLRHCKLACPCYTHMETSKLIWSTNQLPDFSMGATLVSYGLQYVSKIEQHFERKYFLST